MTCGGFVALVGWLLLGNGLGGRLQFLNAGVLIMLDGGTLLFYVRFRGYRGTDDRLVGVSSAGCLPRNSRSELTFAALT